MVLSPFTSFVLQALLKRAQELTPGTSEQTAVLNLVTKIQAVLDNLVVAPALFEAAVSAVPWNIIPLSCLNSIHSLNHICFLFICNFFCNLWILLIVFCLKQIIKFLRVNSKNRRHIILYFSYWTVSN